MRILVACVWFIVIIASGCGDTSPGPSGLTVSGAYQISQTALEDTCGMGTGSISFAGTVTHTAGGTTFTLRDTAGTNFIGTVEPDGDFTASATVGPESAGQTYAERLEGRFTSTGFSATLRVDVSPRNCWFTRSWTATRQ